MYAFGFSDVHTSNKKGKTPIGDGLNFSQKLEIFGILGTLNESFGTRNE
jgi:hypothetical protein